MRTAPDNLSSPGALPIEPAEHLLARRMSGISLDAPPYIDEQTMETEYGVTNGAEVMALCTNDSTTAGVAIVRFKPTGKHASGESEATFGAVSYQIGHGVDARPRFDFTGGVRLDPGDHPISFGNFPGMESDQAALAGGSVWLDTTHTRSVFETPPQGGDRIVIDPGTRVRPGTIWAKRRHSI